MTMDAPLTIAVSARALFDTSADDDVFREQGLHAFSARQRDMEDIPLPPGPAMPLVRGILGLNGHHNDGPPSVEVVLVSGRHPDTGIRAMKSAAAHGINIERAVFTGGESPVGYLTAFGACLFLTRSALDAQEALDSGTAAAVLRDLPVGWAAKDDVLRVAFDGDGVLFDDSSEAINFTSGIDVFRDNETANTHVEMGDGPMRKLAEGLVRLRAIHPERVRIALVTARGAPAHERALRTLRSWGLEVDTAAFLGGRPKRPFLESFGALLFVDDTPKHVDFASSSIPAAQVPWRTDGALATAMRRAAALEKAELAHGRGGLWGVPEQGVAQPQSGPEHAPELAAPRR